MNRSVDPEDGTRMAADRPASVLEQTCVAVITFEPDLTVLDRQFSALATQSVRVLVVDNDSPQRQRIESLATRHGFEFAPLEQNKGVAAAQNVAIRLARTRDVRYMVFLDQDSIPENDALEELAGAYLALCSGRKVCAVGSSYTLQAGRRGSSFVRFGWFGFRKVFCDDAPRSLHEVDFLISSGTLIPCAVLDDVGPMNEDLFIDHVDTEWFLRARSRGYRSFGCCRARMRHALGERTVRVWLGRWRTVPIHSGFRYFFMFRNSLWLYRQPHAPLKWISADLVRLLYILFFSGILISGRRRNVGWMLRGIRAGFQDPQRWRSVEVVQSGRAARRE